MPRVPGQTRVEFTESQAQPTILSLNVCPESSFLNSLQQMTSKTHFPVIAYHQREAVLPSLLRGDFYVFSTLHLQGKFSKITLK